MDCIISKFLQACQTHQREKIHVHSCLAKQRTSWTYLSAGKARSVAGCLPSKQAGAADARTEIHCLQGLQSIMSKLDTNKGTLLLTRPTENRESSVHGYQRYKSSLVKRTSSRHGLLLKWFSLQHLCDCVLFPPHLHSLQAQARSFVLCLDACQLNVKLAQAMVTTRRFCNHSAHYIVYISCTRSLCCYAKFQTSGTCMKL